MSIERLDHITIICDLEETRRFYCDLLGFEVGPRPSLGVPGYWLYCSGVPQIHLLSREPGGDDAPATGAFDHAAFRVGELGGIIERLKERGIPFIERVFPDFKLKQIQFRDPNGVLIELNAAL